MVRFSIFPEHMFPESKQCGTKSTQKIYKKYTKSVQKVQIEI